VSKLEKICASIVGVFTILWLFADHHHSQAALSDLEIEVVQIERALAAGESGADARREVMLETLSKTRRRWIQDEVKALETRLAPTDRPPSSNNE